MLWSFCFSGVVGRYEATKCFLIGCERLITGLSNLPSTRRVALCKKNSLKLNGFGRLVALLDSLLSTSLGHEKIKPLSWAVFL